MQRIADALSKALLVLGAVAIIAMMLHITADVASRYLFDQPIVATLEIVARYYMVACSFLPIAYVQLKRQHIMVEVFTMGLSPRHIALLDGLAGLLGIIYTAILTWLVYGHAFEATVQGEVLSVGFFDLTVWPSRWFLTASFASLCVVLLVQTYADLRFAITGQGGREAEHALVTSTT